MVDSSDTGAAVRSSTPPMVHAFADRTRTLAIALDLGLIALIIAWQMTSATSATGMWIGPVLTVPLLAPLSGLWRANRRTFAWATLCVIPYFVIGLTEVIAQPASREWPGACLALALSLFVVLIAYLRMSRPVRADAAVE